jgi:hypothetical protein
MAAVRLAFTAGLCDPARDHPQGFVHRFAGQQRDHVIEHAELIRRCELDRHLAHR